MHDHVRARALRGAGRAGGGHGGRGGLLDDQVHYFQLFDEARTSRLIVELGRESWRKQLEDAPDGVQGVRYGERCGLRGRGRVNHGCCGGVCLKESSHITAGISHVARAAQPCPCAQWEGRARGCFRHAGSIRGGLERTGAGRGPPGIDGVLRRGPRRNAPSPPHAAVRHPAACSVPTC